MSTAELVVVVMMAAVALGGFTQSVTGFGFALVVAPACALALPGALVVGTIARLAVAVDALVLAGSYREVDRSDATRLAASGLCAVPLGLFLSRVLSVRTLVMVGAVETLVAAGALVLRIGPGLLHRAITPSPAAIPTVDITTTGSAAAPSLTRRPGLGSTAAVGFLAGVLGLTSGLSGPPVALRAMFGGRALTASRGTMAAFFLVVDVTAVLIHPHAASIATMPVLMIAGVAGIWVGGSARARLDDAVVRSAVFGLVLVCALGAMIHSLG